MKKITLTACMLVLLCSSSLPALDREIILGREDRWQDAALIENLIRTTGRWGSDDLVLREAEYTADGHTDLLIHFDSIPFRDHLDHYQVSSEDLLLSRRNAALGAASGGFNSGGRGLHLVPQPGALFYRGTWLQDFSIEFWLYPALLNDGEQLFLWQGTRWDGNALIPQELRCSVQDRRLAWAFENFFTGSDGRKSSLEFAGASSLVPRDWHHHLLRYDSRLGVLEYLVDGIPEAIIYSTDSGRESGSVLLPFAGAAGPGSLRIGGQFTGLLDELRVSPSFVENPNLSRYSNDVGVFQSRTFDLGYTGTKLLRIDAVYRTPGDTAVNFYYRMTDRADADTSGVPWKQFEEGQPLSPTPLGRATLSRATLDSTPQQGAVPSDSRGRYLQVMVELFPDGSRHHSPEVSELRLVYEQDLPPAPPTGLYAEAGNGSVRLYWNPVNEDDLGGYFLYYGTEPGSYRGRDSDLGPSPIDVGKVSQIKVTGLGNSRLYYFSVVAYDATDPPHRSLFSREVSARPSRLLP